MAESKAAWDRVGEDFKALGRQVTQRFEEARPEKPDWNSSDRVLPEASLLRV